ncbi:MAG: sigma-54-dependent Fis family transcriptional regulator [Ignavibacteriaceae bacterium]|nr:sigma-54-dependent Fis family transcriptional regulator [Ignavibacteriaceae bacterium]
MKKNILFIDDDHDYLLTVKRFLETKAPDWDLDIIASPLDALARFTNKNYDCVVLDIKMPAMDGCELLHKFRNLSPSTPIIMASGQSSITLAMECLQNGAFDYIEKPIEHSRLLIALTGAVRLKSLFEENERFKNEISSEYEIVGDSKPMLVVKDLIRKVAKNDITILITGESGTGKELVARGIHSASSRSANTMITVNCAAIAKDLLESELFGYVKGAFTGANDNKIGKIQAANKSTLFLDEIGDMNLELQAKILRVIEYQEVTKIGDNFSQKVDVRFIAATNKNIPDLISKEKFRLDLYYRLEGFELNIPPLRDRKEDIPLLFSHFLYLHSQKHNLPNFQVDNRVFRTLKSMDWVGNVRELKHFVDKLLIFANDQKIGVEDIFKVFELKSGAPFSSSTLTDNNYKILKQDFEKEYLAEALKSNHGNVKKTAEDLGIDRSNLHKKLKALGIID